MAFAVRRSMPRSRPFVLGGVLGSSSLYLLLKVPNGSLWGPIDVTGINLGIFVALGSFAGSLVFEGAVWLAHLIAPLLHHYGCLFEAWLKFRQGRIPPEQYSAYGAVMDYQRIYRNTPSNARPGRDQYVNDVIQWRMKSSRGTQGNSSSSGAPIR
jgi:hypothetical protein